MVFMDQVVAVEHVNAIPWCIFSYHTDFLVGSEEDDVFETSLLVGEDRALPTSSRDDLEVNEVDVDRI
jgi:hypothetical protein